MLGSVNSGSSSVSVFSSGRKIRNANLFTKIFDVSNTPITSF